MTDTTQEPQAPATKQADTTESKQVRELRKESAGYRTRAKDAETRLAEAEKKDSRIRGTRQTTGRGNHTPKTTGRIGGTDRHNRTGRHPRRSRPERRTGRRAVRRKTANRVRRHALAGCRCRSIGTHRPRDTTNGPIEGRLKAQKGLTRTGTRQCARIALRHG